MTPGVVRRLRDCALVLVSIAIAVTCSIKRSRSQSDKMSVEELSERQKGIIDGNGVKDFRLLKGPELVAIPNGIRRNFVPPVNWSSYATIDCNLENLGKSTANLSVQITSTDGKITSFQGELPPGKVTWHIPIFHLSYTAAAHWPSQGDLRFSSDNVRVDTASVSSLEFTTRERCALSLADVRPGTKVLAQEWIDQFGQNSNCTSSPGVMSLSDLSRAEAKESCELSGIEKQTSNGVAVLGPKLRATGFFRLEKWKERWWLVSPSGTLFYSTGINCVGALPFTRVTHSSRRAYRWLPSDSGILGASTKSGGASLYAANLIRKWNANYQEKSRGRAIARMKSWGFTTLGNWCEEGLLKQHQMPYVSMGPETWMLGIQYIDGDIADVYDPRFEENAVKVARPLGKNQNDSMLIGYFIDNELPWWSIPYDIFVLAPDAPAKVAWLKWLQAKYHTIDELNRVWETKASEFNTLHWPGDKANTKANEDMKELLGDFAERFYSTWYKAVKKADPNHLVLGSRIPYAMDEVVLACARHTDVLSFNKYAVAPGDDFKRYYRLTQKPMLIGEYGFDSLDAGLLTAYVPVQNQVERGRGFRYYTEQAAALPFFIGTHYFQYIDEPLTGREDGETSFNGFVAVTDIPYPALTNAARRTNSRIYRVHAGLLPPFSQKPLQ